MTKNRKKGWHEKRNWVVGKAVRHSRAAKLGWRKRHLKRYAKRVFVRTAKSAAINMGATYLSTQYAIPPHISRGIASEAVNEIVK